MQDCIQIHAISQNSMYTHSPEYMLILVAEASLKRTTNNI